MEYEVESKKWDESANYRLLIAAMSKVRWLVSHGRHKRPDGAQDVKMLMERLGKYANEEFGVDYVTQLDSVSEFVGLSIQELRYLADVGEWIETASDGLNDNPNEMRIWRGGTWFDADVYLDRDHYYEFTPEITNTPFGLRVAMVPEPSAISLLALGGLALAINNRRRA